MEVSYYDYTYAASALEDIEPTIILENDYNNLPMDARSLAINIKDSDVDFSAVDESIREYILYRKKLSKVGSQSRHVSDKKFHRWEEIYFNFLTLALAIWLKPGFIRHQFDYVALLFPQTLYSSKKMNMQTGQLVVEALQASITTHEDLKILQNFFEINKENEIRVTLFNLMEGVLGTDIFLLLPKLETFKNIVFFGLVNVNIIGGQPKLEFFLYDLANNEMVTSNYMFMVAFLRNYTVNDFSLKKLQVPIDIHANPNDIDYFKNFIRKYRGKISLFHIYVSDRQQFLDWGAEVLEISSVSLILEYNLFDRTESPYCRIYLEKSREYAAIEFRGDWPWYDVIPIDCKHYRIISNEDNLHGHAIEWGSKIAKFEEARTLLVDDKSGGLSAALIHQWDIACDLGELTKIVMNIPSKRDIKNLKNCPKLIDILLNYQEHQTEVRSGLSSILLSISFHKWDIERLPDRHGYIKALRMSKQDRLSLSQQIRNLRSSYY